MTNRWAVVTNSLWILGLSIQLAAFSYHDWLARETAQRRRDLFKEQFFQLPYQLELGNVRGVRRWALSQADRWWEKALWVVLAASFGWRMLAAIAGVYKRRL